MPDLARDAFEILASSLPESPLSKADVACAMRAWRNASCPMLPPCSPAVAVYPSPFTPADGL